MQFQKSKLHLAPKTTGRSLPKRKDSLLKKQKTVNSFFGLSLAAELQNSVAGDQTERTDTLQAKNDTKFVFDNVMQMYT